MTTLFRAIADATFCASSAAACATALLLSAPVSAQTPVAADQADTGRQDTAVLTASDSIASGRVAINVAAGIGNQEANVAIIAAGQTSVTTASLSQFQDDNAQAGSAASARIADGAMAGSSGLIAVNVTAGSDNQLANLAVIAIGIEAPVAAEPLLVQARASQQPPSSPGGLPSSEAEADLTNSAFAGTTGLVQANVVGGERNSSSNTFVLTLEAGETP